MKPDRLTAGVIRLATGWQSGQHEPFPGGPATHPRSRRPAYRGFTLIEILVVMGLIGLLCSISLPSMFRVLEQKDPMRQSVSDLVEACSQARAQAILSGIPAEVRFLPMERSFQVVTGVRDPGDSGSGTGSMSAMAASAAPPSLAASPGLHLSYHLSQEVFVEMLDVNLKEHKDDEGEVRVRFYPNGTADMLTIVLQWQQQWRKVSVDMVTGLADMVPIR